MHETEAIGVSNTIHLLSGIVIGSTEGIVVEEILREIWDLDMLLIRFWVYNRFVQMLSLEWILSFDDTVMRDKCDVVYLWLQGFDHSNEQDKYWNFVK